MKTHKVIDGLPVVEGDEVEVDPDSESVPVTYPLHGAPFRYDDPFGPAVDSSDWDALK